MGQITALVPFYNEAGRVEKVVARLLKIPQIGRIIAVDDGSQDGGLGALNSRSDTVECIRFKKNRGKSEAVQEGLKRVRSDWTLLCDADITFDPSDLQAGIRHVLGVKNGMGLFCIEDLPKIIQLSGFSQFMTGTRLLKTEVLWAAFSRYHPKEYQLEMVINAFVRDEKIPIYIYSLPINHAMKLKKWTMQDTIVKSLKMLRQTYFLYGLVAFFRLQKSLREL